MGDIVVGVGNIYVLESLFKVCINFKILVYKISLVCYECLVEVICEMLVVVIE